MNQSIELLRSKVEDVELRKASQHRRLVEAKKVVEKLDKGLLMLHEECVQYNEALQILTLGTARAADQMSQGVNMGSDEPPFGAGDPVEWSGVTHVYHRGTVHSVLDGVALIRVDARTRSYHHLVRVSDLQRYHYGS